MRPAADDALLVVDVQTDFLPGGALAVPDGDAVIAPINRLMPAFRVVVATQDWHPPDHVSFAARHGLKPLDVVDLDHGPQALWPGHCVRGTPGAALSEKLDSQWIDIVIRKGATPDVDSYSAFVEADRQTHTGLAGCLRERGVRRVVVTGLATDFCVLWSALDAREAGFAVAVVEDAVRGIDVDGSVAGAWARMRKAGIETVSTDAFV